MLNLVIAAGSDLAPLWTARLGRPDMCIHSFGKRVTHHDSGKKVERKAIRRTV